MVDEKARYPPAEAAHLPSAPNIHVSLRPSPPRRRQSFRGPPALPPAVGHCAVPDEAPRSPAGRRSPSAERQLYGLRQRSAVGWVVVVVVAPRHDRFEPRPYRRGRDKKIWGDHAGIIKDGRTQGQGETTKRADGEIERQSGRQGGREGRKMSTAPQHAGSKEGWRMHALRILQNAYSEERGENACKQPQRSEERNQRELAREAAAAHLAPERCRRCSSSRMTIHPCPRV